ncbi:bifunctional folylpolyglutamate synthase/dihydrofolate synthase [Halobacillus litoralis]|uniref:bifunctional folylpolyglutamate synthase/dihydrofolate synthase n=1 Tax=Halobacillus litoralis TaxID=45668 RepID=UPI001CD49D2C|nr:folylpolyglutamate synthase/dihydrofolate synthase family protein [Halobacillus litoralis]MCA0969917.1 bifunctional folylpolyglutamate synthase/dihydrofolate synthase [Halobacillus litoralis]
MNNYQEALKWIHSREKFKIKPGLDRMTWMMEHFDHPQRTFKAVHIAGTNGKGSTLSFLRELLQAQGLRVGTFTSPYIVRFNERISIDGEPIPDEDLAALVEKIKPVAEKLSETPLGAPTEFEVITAMSMLYFKEQPVDIVIYETGLGGRYDSTNVLSPILTIITNIGKDHMNILGSTFAEIAREKAGIIKKGIPVITGGKQEESIRVIREKAQMEEADFYLLGDHFHGVHKESSSKGEAFVFYNASFSSGTYVSPMMGAHQVDNASLAIQAMELLNQGGFSFRRDLYDQAISATHWPARFEKVNEKPLVVIDGAHNEEGTQALVETVKQHFANRKVTLLYSALEDKPVERMLEMLGGVVDEAYMTSFDFPRALSAEALKRLSPIPETKAVDAYETALETALSHVEADGVLLVTGSLYFISEIRKNFE